MGLIAEQSWQKNELPNLKISQVRLFSLKNRKKKE